MLFFYPALCRSEKLADGPTKRVSKANRTSTSDDRLLNEREKQLAEKEVELRKMQEQISRMQLEMQRQSNTNLNNVGGGPPSNGAVRGVTNGASNGMPGTPPSAPPRGKHDSQA